MPVSPQDRNFVRHLQDFFAPEDLARLYRELHNGATAAYGSEREKQLAGQGAMPNTIRLKTLWMDPWRRWREKFLEEVRPFTWIIYPVQVRYLKPDSQSVPWHQDIGYQLALGARAHKQVLTCFTPLDADPGARATLEFGEAPPGPMKHERQGDFDAVLEKADWRHFHYYRLRRGDCLLFGDYAPHRTFVPEGAVKERSTIEYRLIRPADALEGKDYFDIEKGRYVTRGGDSALNG